MSPKFGTFILCIFTKICQVTILHKDFHSNSTASMFAQITHAQMQLTTGHLHNMSNYFDMLVKYHKKHTVTKKELYKHRLLKLKKIKITQSTPVERVAECRTYQKQYCHKDRYEHSPRVHIRYKTSPLHLHLFLAGF